MSNVQLHLNAVRELINEPRKQSLLLRDIASWNMLCSCLDAIGDTQLAVDAFAQSPAASQGSRYLGLYGLLQALYVQQDAVSNLAAALGILYKRDASLSSVREVRNDAVGHPTKRRDGSSLFLSRSSLSEAGFSLMTTYADGRPPTFNDVRVQDLLAKQEETVVGVLDAFAKQLQDEARRHREEFCSVSFAELFPATVPYYFEKVYEGIARESHREFGAAMAGLLLKVVSAFEAELKRRDIHEAWETIAYEIEELRWPLEELRRFLGGEPSTLNQRSARIFAFYCSEAMKRLEAAASDLDSTYHQE